MSIKGSITALVTPMNEKGDLDYQSLEKLINFQIDSGISGLVAVGTTGESATIDFEDGEGQFCDRGRSYSPAIYYKTESERLIAKRLAPKNSVVPIEPESVFYPVREEHQDYYKKRLFKYNYYRSRCGRDSRLDALNGN